MPDDREETDKHLALKAAILRLTRSRYVRTIMTQLKFTIAELEWIKKEFPRKRRLSAKRRRERARPVTQPDIGDEMYDQ